MSNPPKITIEKRIFKIENGETFLLEYPSNYEEIANKKISKLQKEYESVAKINNNSTISQSKNNNQVEIKKGYISKEKIEKNNLNSDDNNSHNNYYQEIGNVEIFSLNNEICHDNNIKNKKDNIFPLEPKEGFIEIKNKKKEIITNDEKDEKMDNEEFYEVEEKEIEGNEKEENNKEINIKNNTENNKVFEKNNNIINLSPIKNPENVKLAMKKLNFKKPKWAENLIDKDFINMAKKIISSKKNIS